jgi:hypothetical protein
VHPALAEAWLYINGRSDLVAALCLAVLWRALQSRHRVAWVAGAVAAGLGVLSKETFAVAAPFILVASVRGRRNLPAIAAAGMGLALGIVLALALRTDPPSGGSLRMLLDPRMIERWPALVGLAVETLAVPWPRPMRSLSFELGPQAIMHAPWVLALAAVAVWVVVRRHGRFGLHLLGAVAVLLPTALVSDFFWLGFDRYLAMPLVLLVTGCAPALRAWSLDRARIGAAAALAALLVVLTNVAGLAYAGRSEFVARMREARPEDPAGHLLAVEEDLRRGDRQAVLETVGRIPQAHVVGAAAHQLASILHRIGQPLLVTAVLEHAHARDAADPWLRYDMVELRGAQARFDEAFAIAAQLRDDAGLCRPVSALMQTWTDSARLPEGARARARQLARPCGAR